MRQLLFLAALLFATPALAADRYWITLTNHPGEQAYGRIVNGYAVDIVERRGKGDLTTRVVSSSPRSDASSPNVTTVTADPYGFTAWLNATRASYRLPAVVYDQTLTNWAAVNNSHQASRGMGHYVMGSARRQNSAIGHYASVGAMWMASPAHRSALLDPSIRTIGIAGMGSYWTFNGR